MSIGRVEDLPRLDEKAVKPGNRALSSLPMKTKTFATVEVPVPTHTIGIDLGDKRHAVCILDHTTGEILEELSLPNTRPQLGKLAVRFPKARIAMGVTLDFGVGSALSTVCSAHLLKLGVATSMTTASSPAAAIRFPCPRALRHASRKSGVEPPQSKALRAARPSHPMSSPRS